MKCLLGPAHYSTVMRNLKCFASQKPASTTSKRRTSIIFLSRSCIMTITTRGHKIHSCRRNHVKADPSSTAPRRRASSAASPSDATGRPHPRLCSRQNPQPSRRLSLQSAPSLSWTPSRRSQRARRGRPRTAPSRTPAKRRGPRRSRSRGRRPQTPFTPTGRTGDAALRRERPPSGGGRRRRPLPRPPAVAGLSSHMERRPGPQPERPEPHSARARGGTADRGPTWPSANERRPRGSPAKSRPAIDGPAKKLKSNWELVRHCSNA